MNTDNIYRSIVKETEEEVLVYRTFYNKYKDLRTKRVFSDEDLSHFVSLSKIIGLVTNLSKSVAIQLYHEAKNEELFFYSIYVGDIAIIKEYKENEINFEIIEKKVAFQRKDNEYIDLVSYESYKDDEIKVGEKFVVNACLINEYFDYKLPGTRESRKKVLGLCQKKEK